MNMDTGLNYQVGYKSLRSKNFLIIQIPLEVSDKNDKFVKKIMFYLEDTSTYNKLKYVK